MNKTFSIIVPGIPSGHFVDIFQTRSSSQTYAKITKYIRAKMNAGLILRSVCQTINSVVPKILTVSTTPNVLAHRIHYMCNREKLNSPSSSSSGNTCFLLQPVLPIYNSVCGLKVKGRLQLRCKDCYFLCKRERWYVMCKTHPRHKQVQMKKREYKTWILTWASQSKVRGW